MRGRFITIEGADGSGKTTNVGFVVAELEKRGYTVVRTREPGGTPIGEELRKLVLSTPTHLTTEALLFAAMRNEHLETLIRPSLARGEVVVCERFSDSSFAYQGYGRKNVGQVLVLEKMVCNGFEPNHTLFFSVTEEESLKRVNQRTEALDVFETEKLQFRKDVFRGYQTRLKMYAHRMHLIDAMQPIEHVQLQILDFIDQIFVPQNPR